MYASSGSFDVARKVFDTMPRRNAVAWNIMIASFVRRNQPDKALELFRRMVKAGTRPTTVSFVNVFPAIALLKDEGLARLVYGMLVKCGEEYVDDVFVVSSAISMYAELFDVESARRVFDAAKRRNVEVWNTMIGGYVQGEEFEEAVRLFVEVLRSDEVKPDSVTFVNSLMAVSLMMDVGLGQQIHGYLMKKSSNSLPFILYNALIVMYSRCGCVQLAFDLFQQMPERDIVTWNTMISSFVQKDLNLEGLLLVYEMQKQGFLVDPVTITALLSAASNLGNLRIGKETHGYLIRNDIECEGMESYLIDMYSKSSCVEIARLLFDVNKAEERDQVTWNAMIAGYMQNEQPEEAVNLFRKMISEENQIPNTVTLSSILPSCDPIGGVQMGKEIHAFSIRRFLDKNVFVGTALVDMYSRCGEILSAERVFEGMEEKNTVTYTTMLSGYGQHGLGERALSIFQSMKESGIKPDAVTFVALLSACSYSGLVDEGLMVYESMNEYGIVTTQEHSCCIVDMLGRAGRVEDAYEFVQNLKDDNNNIGIWGSLLSACRVNQKFELAKLVSDRLFELETRSDLAGYHVLLSNVYAAEGKWENVNWVRKEMREKGLRKEPGLSWIDVGDASHKFMARDQKHPENDQIYAMLEELCAEMRLSDSKHADTSLIQGVSQVE
ncbi:uncharacterized protein A4U43_C04F34740 [Asparagus officinalis]|uniref:Pentatricopeptide repeat-containing protein n=2 Tax=Asparagus officinalis TaxID=4686 RepID=A0A5P1F8L4_ASPOF|nr:uncharacterized protein A4U43_C04F34740 [Asparagus officinalis]